MNKELGKNGLIDNITDEMKFCILYIQGLYTDNDGYHFPTGNELAKIFHMTPKTAQNWIFKNNLVAKREKYKNKVIEESMQDSAGLIALKWLQSAKDTIDIADKAMKKCNEMIEKINNPDEYPLDKNGNPKPPTLSEEANALFKITSGIKNNATVILNISKELHRKAKEVETGEELEEVICFEYPDKVTYKVDVNGEVINAEEIDNAVKDE